ncbi:uncharacterized protein LOC126820458 [Patella vulgata]|uniref:uncharacterized protein LOC126820458 n=1 Tax=Patella vulgata TaxID=6465 RepID=UPI002180605D|nr:uncharacterized protein LOC126820458 [Patella vulgata]
MSSSHMPGRIILILTTFVFYLVTIVINALSATGGVGLGLFKNTTGDISDAYYLEITPAGWTFSVWGAIYIWQALWLIYGLSTICRMQDGHYLYTLDFMPPAVYAIFIINLCCNIVWLFLWDRQYLIAALCLIAMTPFTLYCTLYFSFSRLYRNLSYMTKRALGKDVWLVRLLVQNGMAFYATWTSVATLLNFGMVLAYKADLEQDIVSTAMLTIVSVEVVFWFISDIVLFDKYTRYIFSPYIMQVIAFSGVVSRNYNLDTMYRNSIFMLTLLIVAAVLLVLKVLILFFRHFTSPITPKDNNYPTSLVNLKI